MPLIHDQHPPGATGCALGDLIGDAIGASSPNQHPNTWLDRERDQTVGSRFDQDEKQSWGRLPAPQSGWGMIERSAVAFAQRSYQRNRVSVSDSIQRRGAAAPDQADAGHNDIGQGPARTRLDRADADRTELDRTQADQTQLDRSAVAARLVVVIGRAARGDEGAFAELYDTTSRVIYGLVLRVLRSTQLAQEVTQEVYLEIWQQVARYTPAKGSVMGWMTTIAHRRAVDRVRSETSDAARNLKYDQRNTEPETDTVWDTVGTHLDAERVRHVLGTLTPIQQEALTLAYFGGHTHVEVAKRLDIPLGTAKTRIRDALSSLREALGVHP